MGTHPRDADDRPGSIPLSHPEEGRVAPGGALAVVADARPRRHAGSARRTACPQEDAYVGVLREAMLASTARPGRRLLRDEHRPALRLDRRGRELARIADNLPPIWGVEAIEVD